MHRIDFEALFERLPSPHMVLDRSLRFVAVNPAYEAATARPRADLIGRPLFEMFPNDGESGRMLLRSIARVFETGESDTLAFIPYDIPRANGEDGFETRYWTAVHTPLHSHAGETLYLMQNTVDVTEMVRQRGPGIFAADRVGPEMQLIERAQEAERAQRSALAESSEFRRLFREAPQMMAVMSGPAHTFTFANDAYRRFVGGRDFVGRNFGEALPEMADQGVIDILDDVFQNGAEHSGEGIRLLLNGEGAAQAEVFLDYSYRPVHDASGAVAGVFLQAADRTETFRHLHHQRLLLDELNHRVNNTLATVQSIAAQTLRTAADLPSARRDLERRIVALSRAHNVLSARSWKGIDLLGVAQAQLAPHATPSVQVGGPEVIVTPQAGIALSMMFHELADNAARHGALSADEGRVQVRWSLGEGGLALEWEEMGGPSVQAPAQRGFGMRIMERVAQSELGGRLSVDFRKSGLFCRIELPQEAYARTENGAAIQ